MDKKEQNKTRSFTNDLDLDPELDNNPDFDLDEYILQQSHLHKNIPDERILDERERSQFKNAILIFLVFAAALLWFNDWSFNNTWASFFGADEGATQVPATAPAPDRFEVQLPPIPPLPGNTEASAPRLDMPITDYLATLRDKGYLGNQISSFSARQLYDANIPISYLDDLQNAGLLEDLSFVYIINYYQNEIPFSYLQQLKDAGVYDKLSFVDVTQYYTNNIPIDYLVTLDKAGYLEDLSFVYVTNFYNAGVTVAFLDKLKGQGLYEDLNFLDIVDLYQRENAK